MKIFSLKTVSRNDLSYSFFKIRFINDIIFVRNTGDLCYSNYLLNGSIGE